MKAKIKPKTNIMRSRFEDQYIEYVCDIMEIKNKVNEVKETLQKYREKRTHRSNKDTGPINIYEIAAILYLVNDGNISAKSISIITNTTEVSIFKYLKIIKEALERKNKIKRGRKVRKK